MQKADRIRIKRNVRTIWISDVHLGFPGCCADYLLEFIRDMRCDTRRDGSLRARNTAFSA